MIKTFFASLALILAGMMFFPACATTQTQDRLGDPTDYCTVVKEPNPLLLGGWSVVYTRTTEDGKSDTNSVKYRLIKEGDRYALYFDRITRGGKKRYMGWRAWTINGDDITSDTGVRIFAQDGKVYYDWKGQGPKEMKRLKN